jgi:hypothetical protein
MAKAPDTDFEAFVLFLGGGDGLKAFDAKEANFIK